jgi:dTDP-4-amino-4,6-dideoxygalactose transaminase
LSVTEKLSGEILSLPLHSDMTSALVQRVVDGIATYFQSVR